MNQMYWLRALSVMYRRSLSEIAGLGVQTMVAPLFIPAFMMLVYANLYTEIFDRLGVNLFATTGLDGPEGYLQYMVAAPIVMASFFATASAGVGIAVERQAGFFDRLAITPLGTRPDQFARRLADGTRIVVFVLALVALARVAGAEVSSLAQIALVVLPLCAALGMAYGGLAFSLCLRSGSAEAAQAVTPLFFPFLFLSSAFVPPPLMPDWMRTLSELNPVSWISDAIRLAFIGEAGVAEISLAWAGVLGLAAITQLLVERANRKVAAE